MWQRTGIRNFGGVLCCSGFLLGLLGLHANSLFAMNNCAIVHHSAPSEANTAYLAGDFNKAEGLYQAALTKNPGDADLAIGLVHTLLREQKLVDAVAAVQASIGDRTASAALLT